MPTKRWTRHSSGQISLNLATSILFKFRMASLKSDDVNFYLKDRIAVPPISCRMSSEIDSHSRVSRVKLYNMKC
jgi:hypothetical protein